MLNIALIQIKGSFHRPIHFYIIELKLVLWCWISIIALSIHLLFQRNLSWRWMICDFHFIEKDGIHFIFSDKSKCVFVCVFICFGWKMVMIFGRAFPKICHHRQIQTGRVCDVWGERQRENSHHRFAHHFTHKSYIRIIIYQTHNLNKNMNEWPTQANKHPTDTCNLWQINVKICHNTYESFEFRYEWMPLNIYWMNNLQLIFIFNVVFDFSLIISLV